MLIGTPLVRMLAAAAIAGAAGACSSDISFSNLPKIGDLTGSSLTFSGGGPAEVERAVTPDDLVAADGSCAASASASAAAASDAASGGAASANPPVARGGVALRMTECEVVTRAGAADKVEIGTNERGDRVATLTWQHGEWPGLYRFTAGRLTSIDELPQGTKPQRPAKAKAKSKQRG